ncbi:hypothetical protein KIPB_014004, partial [Kipferlia bialata]
AVATTKEANARFQAAKQKVAAAERKLSMAKVRADHARDALKALTGQ